MKTSHVDEVINCATQAIQIAYTRWYITSNFSAEGDVKVLLLPAYCALKPVERNRLQHIQYSNQLTRFRDFCTCIN